MRPLLDLLTATIIAGAVASPAATAGTWDLASSEGLELHNTSAQPVTFEGRRAIRVTSSADAAKIYTARQAAPAAPAGDAASAPADALEHLVVIPTVELGNGTIEVDLTGEPGPGAAQGSRGFVGVAFRVQPDRRAYDAFYLRPTNGRAEDQERRNHTTQYVSHPDWPWHRLRQETPGRYESYADIQPAKWIHVRIDVMGETARLYVDGAEQPVLIVNDLKSGVAATGGVALWIEGSTVAHFANLKVVKR